MSSIPPAWSGFWSPWLRLPSTELLRVACVLALFVAIFSGRFSFVRFTDDLARADWLQLRIWFTALAALGWVVLQRRADEARGGLGAGLVAWISVLALLYVYLFGHALVLGDPGSATQHVTDILLIAVQAFLVIGIVRAESDLVWFAGIAEAVGIVLFLFCIAGFGNPDVNGAGWAPFGGPITFYRLEFLAFCCALYLFARGREPIAYLHLPVAAVALFSALASLSKVAFVGAAVAAVFLLFWLLSTRRWARAAIVGLTVGLTFSVFHLVRGEILAARVSESLLTTEISVPDPNWTISVQRRIESGEDVRFADLPAWQQSFIRAIVSAPDVSKIPLQTLLQDLSRVMLYEDNSGRARLWAHAWDLFRANPWFGVGMGNYEVAQVNRYSKEIERYRYPHNIVLEFGATVGVTGLALFAVLIFISFVLLQQRVMAQPALLYMAAYPLFVLLTALAGGDYFDFRIFWLFTLIVLVAVARDSARPGATVATAT